jgi:hypothetical protein
MTWGLLDPLSEEERAPLSLNRAMRVTTPLGDPATLLARGPGDFDADSPLVQASRP